MVNHAARDVPIIHSEVLLFFSLHCFTPLSHEQELNIATLDQPNRPREPPSWAIEVGCSKNNAMDGCSLGSHPLSSWHTLPAPELPALAWLQQLCFPLCLKHC